MTNGVIMDVPLNSTVFVIDDDAGVRGLLSSALIAEGYAIEQASSAEEFLESFEGARCGCVLCDMVLPGMSGIDLLKTLRARQIEVPVIIISAFGDIPSAVHSMRLGAMDFIEKPFDHGVLLEKVRAALLTDAARRQKCARVEAAQQRLTVLSPREMDLLKGLMAGKSSKMLAADFGISLRTVEKHRANILVKSGAANTADLVRMATIAGLA